MTFRRSRPTYREYGVKIGDGDIYHMPNRHVAETFIEMWTRAPHREDVVLMSRLPPLTDWTEEPGRRSASAERTTS